MNAHKALLENSKELFFREFDNAEGPDANLRSHSEEAQTQHVT